MGLKEKNMVCHSLEVNVRDVRVACFRIQTSGPGAIIVQNSPGIYSAVGGVKH